MDPQNPATENDFLTNVQAAFIKVFKGDVILKEYNWEDWDSDKIVKLPRGSMIMAADSELGYGDAWLVRPEISLEGKPKRQKLSAVMGRLHKTVTAANLHDVLNTASGGKVKFYQRAERFTLRQTVEGDVRTRTVAFNISAAPLV